MKRGGVARRDGKTGWQDGWWRDERLVTQKSVCVSDKRWRARQRYLLALGKQHDAKVDVAPLEHVERHVQPASRSRVARLAAGPVRSREVAAAFASGSAPLALDHRDDHLLLRARRHADLGGRRRFVQDRVVIVILTHRGGHMRNLDLAWGARDRTCSTLPLDGAPTCMLLGFITSALPKRMREELSTCRARGAGA